jgi:hypothetical protein
MQGEEALDKVKGLAKQAFGAVTGDEELQAEGRAEREEGGAEERGRERMPLDWGEVIDRYQQPGEEGKPIPGAPQTKVTGVDEERIYVEHRLWKDSLSRRNLEKAVELLEENRLPKGAEDAIGKYRMLVADERPTLATKVLKDLGYLE